jgi:hypothetical protein
LLLNRLEPSRLVAAPTSLPDKKYAAQNLVKFAALLRVYQLLFVPTKTTLRNNLYCVALHSVTPRLRIFERVHLKMYGNAFQTLEYNRSFNLVSLRTPASAWNEYVRDVIDDTAMRLSPGTVNSDTPTSVSGVQATVTFGNLGLTNFTCQLT